MGRKRREPEELIEVLITLMVERNGVQVYTTVPTCVRYRRLDPTVIQFIFEPSVQWDVSREMLHAGTIYDVDFNGDVAIKPINDTLSLRLSNGPETATFLLSMDRMTKFLDRTYDMFAGDGNVPMSIIDDTINRILVEGAPQKDQGPAREDGEAG